MITMGRVRLAFALAAAALAAAAAPAPAAVTVGHSGWTWGTPSPQGHTIEAIEFAGEQGYAAGAFGTLLRTGDSGATWSGSATGIRQTLVHIAIVDTDSVVVAGGCAVRRSDDYGDSFRRLPWTATDARCAATVAGIDFLADGTGYLVLTDGSVFRTADGGRTWSRRTTIPAGNMGGSPFEPTAVAFLSADTGFATTTAGHVYSTTDGGTSWTLVYVHFSALRDIHFVGGLTAYVVGDSGVAKSIDGGASWAYTGANVTRMRSIRCADTLTCLVAVEGGKSLLRTTDGGLSFTYVTPSTESVHAVGFSSASRAVAAGERGVTVTSDDAGGTWRPVGARLTATFSRVRAVSSTLVFAAGPKGTLARSTDGGASWTELGVSTAEDVIDVSFADDRNGYAVDAAGTVLRTDNGGVSWQILNTGFSTRPQAVLALSPTRVLLVGPLGVLRSSDGGESFVRIAGRLVSRAKLFNVDRGGSTVFAYGSKNIVASTNGGRTWKKVLRPRKSLLAVVDFVTGRFGYALGQDGQVFKTRNRGRRWSDLSGIGTDDATGLSFSSPSRGFLTLRRFGGDSNGYLLRTTDGGRTWRPQLVSSAQPSGEGIVAAGPQTAFLLTGSSSLLFTSTGGDRGEPSKVTLRTKRRTVRRRAVIRVTGKVSGASAGAEVVVARRERGESGWSHEVATVASNGTFTTTWKLAKTAAFVGQWAGDADSTGDGSPALLVRAKRR
jgi:photosystem II stability/assembly factor-like uncharacterized protein